MKDGPYITTSLVRVHQTIKLAGGDKDFVSLAVIRQCKDKTQLQFIGMRSLRNLESLHYIERDGSKYKVLRPIGGDYGTDAQLRTTGVSM